MLRIAPVKAGPCHRGLSPPLIPRRPAACPGMYTVAGTSLSGVMKPPLTDCHIPGTVAGVLLPPRPRGEKMSALKRATVYTVRITAVAAATPLAGRRCGFSRNRKAGRLGTPAARQVAAVRRGQAVLGTPAARHLTAVRRGQAAQGRTPRAGRRLRRCRHVRRAAGARRERPGQTPPQQHPQCGPVGKAQTQPSAWVLCARPRRTTC